MATIEIVKEEELLNDILAEVETDNFCECAATNKEKKNIVKVNTMNKTAEKKQKKNIKIDNETVKSLGKTVALMVATGVCGYFELMSPILYAPIELVCLCAVCFKLGEYKGKTYMENR